MSLADNTDTTPSAPTGRLAAAWARAQVLEATAEFDDDDNSADLDRVWELHGDIMRGEIRCDADAFAKLKVASLYVDCDRVDRATIPAIADATDWLKRRRA
jgi:hypothetical protein